jgi:hypothetical protein
VGALYETLWCSFVDVVAQTNLRYGLKIESTGVAKVCNANVFVGGQFVGAWGGLLIDGPGAGTENLGNAFHGVKFDAMWNAADPFSALYRPAAQSVFGWLTNNCYVWPVVTIKVAKNTGFYGCYFEVAGAPTTFNDGVNGSADLIATIWLDNATSCIQTGVHDGAFNSVYLYDAGLRSKVTPTTDGFEHDNILSPCISARKTNSQTIATSAWTNVEWNQVLRDSSNHLEWDAANYLVKIRQPGVYQISATVVFEGWATALTYGVARVNVDGFFYPGTTAIQDGSSHQVTPTVSVCVPLVRGDTVKIECLQNSAGNQTLSVSAFSIVKIA